MRVLCLGGGVLAGYFQLPIIQALLETHKYDCIYGESIGALNGIMVAQQKQALLPELWARVNSLSDILTLKWWWPFNGLYNMGPLKELMAQNVSLGDLQIPFITKVKKHNTGEPRYIYAKNLKTNKQLRNVLAASAAVPNLIVPQQLILQGTPFLGSDAALDHFLPTPPPGPWTHLDMVVCQPTTLLTGMYAQYLTEAWEIRTACPAKPSITLYAPSEYTGSIFKNDSRLRAHRWKLGLEAVNNPIQL